MTDTVEGNFSDIVWDIVQTNLAGTPVIDESFCILWS
jgi:hypothetical protein